MTTAEIDAALDAAEAEIAGPRPESLMNTGYWRALAAIKRDRALIDRYADRVGVIDAALFRARVPIVLPMWAGTSLAGFGAITGLVLVAAAYSADPPWNGLLLLAGTGALLVATHGMTHLVVGTALGIRFIAWFSGRHRPQPGVKTDYASYLRAPARRRAWMHASAPIVTKAIPFLLIPAALAAQVPWWAVAALVGLGFVQLLTDALWSIKASDWSKFRREMKIARRYEGG